MAYCAVVGASGYAGRETLDRILSHPDLELVALGSDSQAGRPAGTLDPRLNGSKVPDFVSNDEAISSGADVIFLCLPHERAAGFQPPAEGVIVDLSGAHRLHDAADYETWYGFAHPFPGGLADWSYAVPELAPPQGRLVANPGCYATAALLAISPLTDAIDPETVVIDAKSGVTGAGRALTRSSHATQVLENLTPYRVGSHQHAAEISQMLGFPVCFVPHLLPVRRGLVVTCYARRTEGALRERLEAAYAAAPAVRVLPPDVAPELTRVSDTDQAEIGLFEDRLTGRAIIICALDNLGKGAAGQAVQNANLALGYPETAGLKLTGAAV